MRVRSLRWAILRLPFREPFSTSYGVLTHREGLLLRLVTDEETIGYGAGSALVRPGGASLQDAPALLDAVAPTLIGRDLEEIVPALDRLAKDRRSISALRCALDIAVCDARAKQKGISVARLLADDTALAPAVSVNAIIGAPSAAAAMAAAAGAQAAGFGSVKLKVGIAGSIDEERERVAAVRQALGPDIRLRLDANGAWQVEQAIRTIQALEEHDLEFVEQPLPAGDLAGMRRVREAVSTLIAADEDVTDLDAARRVLQEEAAQVLVLKPVVLGGLRPAREIARMVAEMGGTVVVTTTIDAGVATAAALHLAATLSPGGPACGLATGALLVSDLLTHPLEIGQGRMRLPDGPGLGVKVDESEMDRYCDVRRQVQ